MNPLRIHVLQHVPFEGPAALTEWFAANNCSVNYTRFYEANSILPPLDSFDRLVIMGGPMSVTDEAEHPWLKEEKQFIRTAVDNGKTVVGICLGSQLLAAALGQRVYPGKQPEIGWFPIYKTEEGKNTELLKAFPDETVVFHWHGDTFDLPPQAKRLFYSEVTPNQSFAIGTKVLALQCHLEVTEDAIDGMLDVFSHHLIDAPFVQSAEEIRRGYQLIETNKQLLFRVMDALD
ncbi:type 1 glutamine amidotransferase [Mangrovibacterium diazotrophicum]|uniref:GMP synthase-like glutamine amidotransferase n=1 Tax=Mangrovibacterium diazotrophicum TaxID=1261403 RepID=A0A419VUL8_9BACT|nr:type 1 glutamine amidotransferase [Mangrovibacterium diazotrophicum]RKD85191.1 GMP synthase-like glutamine amidotransferase [Mangrovibacterium diazotrophicum]